MNLYRSKNLLGKTLWVSALLCSTLSGCTLFFGSIRPVEEKSDDYSILDLSKTNQEWTSLNHFDAEGLSEQTYKTDRAFQSQSSTSIISINTACRRYQDDTPSSLKTLTGELLLGISSIQLMQEKLITIAKNDALQTTFRGVMEKREVKAQIVVLQKNRCIYDLMFISKPETFDKDLSVFEKFVSSLHLN